MQIKRNFENLTRQEGIDKLRAERAEYAKLDNQKADLSPENDRITLSSDGHTLDVGIYGDGFTERITQPDGSTTISSFKIPGRLGAWLFEETAKGTEVHRSAEGHYSGTTMEKAEYNAFEPDGPIHYEHLGLNSAQAETTFIRENARFG